MRGYIVHVPYLIVKVIITVHVTDLIPRHMTNLSTKERLEGIQP